MQQIVKHTYIWNSPDSKGHSFSFLMPFQRLTPFLRVADVCYSASHRAYGRIVDKCAGQVTLQVAHMECILYSKNEKVYELYWNAYIIAKIQPDQRSVRDHTGRIWITVSPQKIIPQQDAVNGRFQNVADEQTNRNGLFCYEHLGEEPTDSEIFTSVKILGGASCSGDPVTHVCQ